MQAWLSWLERGSYEPKVGGSSPPVCIELFKILIFINNNVKRSCNCLYSKK